MTENIEEQAKERGLADMEAFPRTANEWQGDEGAPGMTFRQYAAVKAMQGLLAKGNRLDAIGEAIRHADDLIAGLSK